MSPEAVLRGGLGDQVAVSCGKRFVNDDPLRAQSVRRRYAVGGAHVPARPVSDVKIVDLPPSEHRNRLSRAKRKDAVVAEKHRAFRRRFACEFFDSGEGFATPGFRLQVL